MVVTLIGTGRLGTNLYAALKHAGHEVVHLQGRNFHPEDICGDVVILAVKDDVIAQVAERLSACHSLVVHTSGSVAMSVLSASRRGVFYPMQTFSKERLVDFGEIPLFIEAEQEEDIKLLELLASSLSPKVYRLDSKQRGLLHVAAVFACNFTNHCYDLAAEVLKQAGLPFDILLPLTDETARKVHSLSPRQAQTGPALRDDKEVMSRHEAMLSGTSRDIYHLMSQSIHDKLRLKED